MPGTFDLAQSLLITLLKQLWGHTSELRQDFQNPSGNVDVFKRPLSHDVAEWELHSTEWTDKEIDWGFWNTVDVLMVYFLDIGNLFLFSYL